MRPVEWTIADQDISYSLIHSVILDIWDPIKDPKVTKFAVIPTDSSRAFLIRHSYLRTSFTCHKLNIVYGSEFVEAI